jgi:hypothetical protein
MTDKQINAAIAEACGWKDIFEHPEFGLMGVAKDTHGCRTGIEDYTHDLNAMHEAERVLAGMQQGYYWGYLQHITDNGFEQLHATARQRAEAFLRTLGKWES